MAQLFNPILGDPSGRLGHVVFSRRKGANFIGPRPSARSSEANAIELAIRSKFGLTQKIAKSINSIQLLKDVWPKSTGRMSKCNEIFQANYKVIKSVEDFGSVKVSPFFGFALENGVLTATTTGIHFVSDALGVSTGIDTGTEKQITATGVIVLLNPTSEEIPNVQIIPFQANMKPLDLLNPMDFTVDFVGSELAMYQSYGDRKVFGCLITVADSGKAIHYSTTINSL
jgi:hypothetical protein